jgi:uncharacterized membrane protein
MLWHVFLVPSSHFPIAGLLILVVGPLLLPFKGLLNANLKSCTWMSYLSLFYFAHGIAEVYANPSERYFAMLEVLFSLLLCFGAGLYVYQSAKR